jgi:RNA polymerase sigma factor (sigma-70 family)
MRTYEVLNNDLSRRWFLDSPEADVLSTADERKLLQELADCKERILEAIGHPDGSEWGVPAVHAQFQKLVRDLASAGMTRDPHTAALRSLARRYQEIRTSLAMANSRLVAHVAKQYSNRGIPMSDLIQEGFCGLLTAVDRFDLANTTRLATYAVWWIRQAMQRAVAGGAYPVRLNVKQLQRLTRAISQAPEIQGGRPAEIHPTHGDGSPSYWPDLAAIRPRVSLDAPCGNDGSTPLSELLASEPGTDHDGREALEVLHGMIRLLKPREQAVLTLRFGLDGAPRHSLSQVSKVLDVSKERIRQIQERALEKLRVAADGRGFFDPSQGADRGAGGHGAGTTWARSNRAKEVV